MSSTEVIIINLSFLSIHINHDVLTIIYDDYYDHHQENAKAQDNLQTEESESITEYQIEVLQKGSEDQDNTSNEEPWVENSISFGPNLRRTKRPIKRNTKYLEY